MGHKNRVLALDENDVPPSVIGLVGDIAKPNCSVGMASLGGFALYNFWLSVIELGQPLASHHIPEELNQLQPLV